MTLPGHRTWKARRRWHHGPWEHQPHGPPHWRHASRRTRRLLLLRFVGGFGLILALLLGGMAVLAFLITRLFGGDSQMALVVWIAGCGLALALPVLAALLAALVFRRVAVPLADVMAAADAVAEGDLAARVPEQAPGEFGQLARSFNRMAEELERADQRRRNLTADVAHELRTPLQVIQGNLEGVLDGVYEPNAEHIGATLEETRSLTRLVEDLRILSLAETGQLPMQWEPVDVGELLADVQTSFSGQAEAAGLTLAVSLAEKVGQPPSVFGDVGRLNQVLSNLVANALRHTPAGGTITLDARAVPAGVQLRVVDTGHGIPPEDLPYVFDRFWKGDRARRTTGGAGSGLGLAIARQLVQAHGGQITVASQPGQGTTFQIELPVDLELDRV